MLLNATVDVCAKQALDICPEMIRAIRAIMREQAAAELSVPQFLPTLYPTLPMNESSL